MSAYPRSRARRACGPHDIQWSVETIHALGVSTDLATAAQIFDLSLATAYRLVRRDAFPVPVIRAGARCRVPIAPVLAALGLAPPASDRATDPPRSSPATMGTRPSDHESD